MGAFVISKRFNGAFKFVFTSRKGKTIFTSMAYLTKEACESDIAFMKLTLEDGIYSKFKASNGKHFFKLQIAERILAVSRKYSTVLLLQKGIDEIMRTALKAEILDFSEGDFMFPLVDSFEIES